MGHIPLDLSEKKEMGEELAGVDKMSLPLILGSVAAAAEPTPFGELALMGIMAHLIAKNAQKQRTGTVLPRVNPFPFKPFATPIPPAQRLEDYILGGEPGGIPVTKQRRGYFEPEDIPEIKFDPEMLPLESPIKIPSILEISPGSEPRMGKVAKKLKELALVGKDFKISSKPTTGFILPDGTIIDMKGGDFAQHRFVMGEDLPKFMEKTGIIRANSLITIDSFDIHRKPTQEQISAIKQINEMSGNEIVTNLSFDKFYRTNDFIRTINKIFIPKLSTPTEGKVNPIRSEELINHLPDIFTPEQLRGFLSGKVKKSEIEGLGLDLLMEGKGKLNKQEVLGKIRQNVPQVEEVVKGQGEQIDITKRADEILSIWLDEGQKDTPLLRQRARNEALGETEAETDTKFSQYQLPGGENYEEFILRDPKDTYSHADFPDVKGYIAHGRSNMRTAADDKKVYFIEETQSKRNEAVRQGQKELSHPLLKNWATLVLKAHLRRAIAAGADYVSWTTGEQQAERYDLSKQVDNIEYIKRPNGEIYLEIYTKGETGGVVSNPVTTNAKEIANIIGKEPAEKILKAEYPINKEGNIIGKLTQKNLKIGGEWAKNLYDRQIPNILKDLTKGEVGSVDLKIKDYGKEIGRTSWGTPILGGPITEEKTQPAFKITPEIRERVKKGFELFSKAELKDEPIFA